MDKQKINQWIDKLIETRQTVITLLGITDNEMVLDVFWNEWSALECRLRQYNIQTFGKTPEEIEKLKFT